VKKVTATGQTVNEAVESALKDLNTTKDKVNVRIVDEGKKGFFGLFGSKPAIVEVEVNDDPFTEAEKFLKNVIDKMGVDASIETIRQGNEVTFQLSGSKIALLIGKRGQTLNSLQYLTQLVANNKTNQYVTIIVDAENYREKRKQTLQSLAERVAQKAIRTNKEVKLEPMPSFERKVIHTTLYKNKKVRTYSDGVEPNRHIVITPNQTK
jgi:spoIIIJ-associated protein